VDADGGVAARHSSESVEHYTPSAICQAACVTLGGIDLDPASCEEANRVVQATRFFTREENGFKRPWEGRVFLNPPGGSSDDQERRVQPKCRETGSCGLLPGHTHEGVESSSKKWWFRLMDQCANGGVTSAIFVAFSLEILQTTQVAGPRGMSVPLEFPICYPTRRVSYVKPGGAVGSQPPHASAIVLVTFNLDTIWRFKDAFSGIGHVVIPLGDKIDYRKLMEKLDGN
jgi:hypothetical protein